MENLLKSKTRFKKELVVKSSSLLAPFTLSAVESMVQELDIAVERDSPEFAAGVILMTSAFLGTKMADLKRFTGFPVKFLWKLDRAWRSNGVWLDGRRCRRNRGRYAKSENCLNVEWLDESLPAANQCIAFWCDVGVGLGTISRGYESIINHLNRPLSYRHP